MSRGKALPRPDCDRCDEPTLRPVFVEGSYRERPWIAQLCPACHAQYVKAAPGSEERARIEFALGVFRTAMPLLPHWRYPWAQ